jgi:hypothetical protein
MACSDEGHGRSRRPSEEDRGWSHRSGFLVEPQNQGRRFVSGLASKPLGRFLQFSLKTGGTVSWLSLKTKVVEGFPVWASKPAALVW